MKVLDKSLTRFPKIVNHLTAPFVNSLCFPNKAQVSYALEPTITLNLLLL
nr:MAG TPA: hypothetical protein [Caudoviricetes sp.]